MEENRKFKATGNIYKKSPDKQKNEVTLSVKWYEKIRMYPYQKLP